MDGDVHGVRRPCLARDLGTVVEPRGCLAGMRVERKAVVARQLAQQGEGLGAPNDAGDMMTCISVSSDLGLATSR